MRRSNQNDTYESLAAIGFRSSNQNDFYIKLDLHMNL